MSKKTLIIITIIIALIAIGAAATYITLRQGGEGVRQGQPVATLPQTPEESTTTEAIDTSNWKVYHNEKYGFEVKYPPDWEYSDLVFQWGFEVKEPPTYEEPRYRILVMADTKIPPEQVDFDGYIRNQRRSTFFTLQSYRQISIPGGKAKAYEFVRQLNEPEVVQEPAYVIAGPLPDSTAHPLILKIAGGHRLDNKSYATALRTLRNMTLSIKFLR